MRKNKYSCLGILCLALTFFFYSTSMIALKRHGSHKKSLRCNKMRSSQFTSIYKIKRLGNPNPSHRLYSTSACTPILRTEEGKAQFLNPFKATSGGQTQWHGVRLKRKGIWSKPLADHMLHDAMQNQTNQSYSTNQSESGSSVKC